MVDDEEQILKSFKRRLRKNFSMDTALSGRQGLDLMDKNGPYAVVVSDYRMPKMDGVEFLRQVREKDPDTLRIMLTGFADLQTAIKAVNQSQVFRFLTKPCPPEVLIESLNQAIRFYEFVKAEREVIGLKRWRKSLEQLIFSIIKLVESRDPYTAGHQQRVALLSEALANAMGLSKDQVSSVQMAAAIHDIGKIYVPIDFLNKPSALSPQEFDIIKQHPQVGYDILKPVEFEHPIGEMVLQHHERMDGTGYPLGLKGDQILLEARIISVADVVEAMSSHRPYRPSRGMERALTEIEKKAGRQYDARVVETCLALFKNNAFSFERVVQ